VGGGSGEGGGGMEAADGGDDAPAWERCPAPVFAAASCGYYHTMLVSADGSASACHRSGLYACGAAKAGRLGLGPSVVATPDRGVWAPSEVSLCHLVAPPEAAPAIAVSAAAAAAAAAAAVEGGEEKEEGGNAATATTSSGDGNRRAAAAPPPFPRVAGVSAGDMHTLVALLDGRVLACGYGGGGRLGNADAYIGRPQAGNGTRREAAGSGGCSYGVLYAPGSGSEPQAKYAQQDIPMPVQGGLRVL
jgi:hypothetical protein